LACLATLGLLDDLVDESRLDELLATKNLSIVNEFFCEFLQKIVSFLLKFRQNKPAGKFVSLFSLMKAALTTFRKDQGLASGTQVKAYKKRINFHSLEI
jgi:hypothetical protein